MVSIRINIRSLQNRELRRMDDRSPPKRGREKLETSSEEDLNRITGRAPDSVCS